MRSKEVEEAIGNVQQCINTSQYPDDDDMETVLSYIYELEKENQKQRGQLNSAFDNGFIHKDKIRDKIKEIEENPNNPYQKVMASQIDASLISCLKELLGGDLDDK